MVLVAAVAAAGTIFAAKATPEPAKPVAVSRTVPAGDKPFAPICKSNGVIEGRPDPAGVGQSFANDHCRAPRMPAPVDGVTIALSSSNTSVLTVSPTVFIAQGATTPTTPPT